ncbi:MAG: hypothetical protein MJ250_04830 [Alphaproteobacteria bacterium]|nr:hypothetical protein [Alphaproteobacteria bacterium]
MSENTEEFFAKGSVQKFKSGLKNLDNKLKKSMVIGAGILATAFAVGCSNPNVESEHTDNVQKTTQIDYSKPTTAYAITEQGDTLCSYTAIPNDSISFVRLQDFVNGATKSETGREVLLAISEQGTTLTVDKADATTIGFFDPSANAIVLNTNFDDNTLASCLIHEGKHSKQDHDLNPKSNVYYTFLDNTILSRAMEADAMATQAKFSYEMREQGDSLIWNSFAKSHPHITQTFEKNAKQYGKNSNTTMTETMLSWYDDIPYSTGYDQTMLEYEANISQQLKGDVLKHCFNEHIDADSVITKVCTQNGKPYAGTDGSILKTPRTLSLTIDMFDASVTIAKYQNNKSGTCDMSAVDMYIVNGGKPMDQTFRQLINAAEKTHAGAENTHKQEVASKSVQDNMVQNIAMLQHFKNGR